MKATVSIPDKLFLDADRVAKELKVSRSRLYATAIEQYLRQLRDREITAKLNEVYAKHPSKLDPALDHAQIEAIEERW